MGRKQKLSVEQKINICEQYLHGKKSIRNLSDDVGVNENAVKRWIIKYQTFEASIFNSKAHNAKYTVD